MNVDPDAPGNDPRLFGPAPPLPAREEAIRAVDAEVWAALEATADRADKCGYMAIRHILYAMMTGDRATMRDQCDAAQRWLRSMAEAREGQEAE